jgi:hypothetical protein
MQIFLLKSITFQTGSANSSQRNSFSNASGVPAKPLSSPSAQQPPMQQANMIIFGHDVDSVDVATRVAMVSGVNKTLKYLPTLMTVVFA